MFCITTHSTHFIYGYMASGICRRTTQIVREVIFCRHCIGYYFRLATKVILYAPSGTRNSSLGPPWRIDPTTYHTINKRSYHGATSLFNLCSLYSTILQNVPYTNTLFVIICLQPYLQKPIALKYKYILSKYRLSAHGLSIETGRYHHIDRNDRICSLCNMNIL